MPKTVFFEEKDNFWQLKKICQVFGNFFTFKWQFSGGSGALLTKLGPNLPALPHLSDLSLDIQDSGIQMINFNLTGLKIFLSRCAHMYK